MVLKIERRDHNCWRRISCWVFDIVYLLSVRSSGPAHHTERRRPGTAGSVCNCWSGSHVPHFPTVVSLTTVDLVPRSRDQVVTHWPSHRLPQCIGRTSDTTWCQVSHDSTCVSSPLTEEAFTMTSVWLLSFPQAVSGSLSTGSFPVGLLQCHPYYLEGHW